MKCDNCNKQATVHPTEIKNGKKLEKHLCEQCAAQSEGLNTKTHMPINELLTNFGRWLIVGCRTSSRRGWFASIAESRGGISDKVGYWAANMITPCLKRR